MHNSSWNQVPPFRPSQHTVPYIPHLKPPGISGPQEHTYHLDPPSFLISQLHTYLGVQGRYRGAEVRTVVELMPAGGHDLDGDGRPLQRGRRAAAADLATTGGALRREEDLEPAQAARLAREGVQGLKVLPLGEPRAAPPGVQGEAELYIGTTRSARPCSLTFWVGLCLVSVGGYLYVQTHLEAEVVTLSLCHTPPAGVHRCRHCSLPWLATLRCWT